VRHRRRQRPPHAIAIAVLIAVCPAFALADAGALILSGVPGSEEHRTKFAEWSATTRDLLIDRFGFAEDEVVVLADREARAEDIRSAFASFADTLGDDDTFFLFFIGHGAADREDYKFNIMGADLTSVEYSGLIDSVGAGRTVIVNGTNSSGASIAMLGGETRVVVTATRSGSERNDPIFYQYFLDTLSTDAADEDLNERISVWEAFRYTTLEIERFYGDQGRLATEHPQIAANGEEPTGVDPENIPALAQSIAFNSDRDLDDVADPELRALIERQRELESDVAVLREAQELMDPAEFTAQLQELLLELAMTSRQIRELEAGGDTVND
jgi:hypothetical protein